MTLYEPECKAKLMIIPHNRVTEADSHNDIVFVPHLLTYRIS